ncbi:hypothetical protein GO289_05051 [Ralstonia solanacearum]|nr:hypothetical protein [Ralstonia solanacearum]
MAPPGINHFAADPLVTLFKLARQYQSWSNSRCVELRVSDRYEATLLPGVMFSKNWARCRLSLHTNSRTLTPRLPMASSRSPIGKVPWAPLPRLKYIDGWKPQQMMSMLCLAAAMAS